MPKKRRPPHRDTESEPENPRRRLPSVERVLHRLAALPDLPTRDETELRAVVRAALAAARAEIAPHSAASPPEAHDMFRRVVDDALRRLAARATDGLRAVVNATGVVLHTNLGRAPLPDAAIEAVASVAGYSNLEYDLEKGRRGRRDIHCEDLLRELLGCEAAVVVNNCAAATFLILDTLAQGGEAVISRGELVEIGGGFRIPDIMRKSGAILREVGTTNRTRLADYEAAVTDQTKMIMRVHPSNFRLVGFSERPTVAELAGLARARNAVFFEDVGSGALIDLHPYGLHDEPLAARSLKDGADIVALSGDKLLGGPQAGVIAGRQDLVERVRRNPLMRMVRVDKMTYAALEAVLRLYRTGQTNAIPALAALAQSPSETRSRARRFLRRVKAALGDRGAARSLRLVEGFSLVGGGAAPQATLPATLIAISAPDLSPHVLESRLRRGVPPVIARIEDDAVMLDLRTVSPRQEAALLKALVQAVAAPAYSNVTST
jgi:L-seryl-tRNA(Ser) seleniumtransferase